MATASKPSSDSKEELLISAIGTASAAGSNAPAPSLKTKESEKMVQFVEPIDNQEKEFEEMRKSKNSSHFYFLKSAFTDLTTELQTRELRKLISLGLALPSLLNTLLEQFSDIDGDQLHNNLKKVFKVALSSSS